MTTISLDRKIALDLVESRMRQINDEISLILERWNQASAALMIQETRRGNMPEAEVDAIALVNLLEKRDQVDELLREVGRESE